MAFVESRVSENYRRVMQRVEGACARAGRGVSSVKLVAVTKYAEWEWVRALVDLGVRRLGESRPQQLVERVGQLPEEVEWHLIGPLQRNKARKVLPATALIHSVDSLKLLRTLERLAGEMELEPRVLLEVNVAGEAAKHGFSAEGLVAAWDAVLECKRVRVEGLMTMAPYSEDAEDSRWVFRELRKLRNELAERSGGALTLPELSMGMSGDFEVGIEEGATLIRVGTTLFEGLGEARSSERGAEDEG